MTDPNSPIAIFLAAMGKALLKASPSTGWLDMAALAELCRKHKIRFDTNLPTQQELESMLPGYFEQTDEFSLDGVNVSGYPRRIRWDLVFMVRFDHAHPILRQTATATPTPTNRSSQATNQTIDARS